MYYTKYKGENKKENIDNQPYFIKAETTESLDNGNPSSVTFYAVNANDNEKLGKCSISKTSAQSPGVMIKTLELLDHNFDHCGIGSTLLNIAENYAYQKLGIDHAVLVCSPDPGYEDTVNNLYYMKFDYAKFTALGHLMKQLDEDSLVEMLDLDDIQFTQVEPANSEEQEKK